MIPPANYDNYCVMIFSFHSDAVNLNPTRQSQNNEIANPHSLDVVARRFERMKNAPTTSANKHESPTAADYVAKTLAKPISLTFAPDTHTGGWPAALADAQQSLGAALVPTATLSPPAEPTFVTRPFDESFTLDEFLITRTDFSNQALEVTKFALREVTTWPSPSSVCER